MAVDGLPVSIKMFTFPGDEAALKQFYASYWKTAGNGQTSEKNLGGMNVLGYELDGMYTSVQYRSIASGIEGKIMVSPVLSERRKPERTTLPVPSGSKTLSRVETLDSQGRTETLTLLLMKPKESALAYYHRQLENQGWQKLFESVGDDGSTSHYQSERGQLQITIKTLPGSNGKATQILVNWLRQQ